MFSFIQNENEDAKLTDMKFAIVKNVNMRCSCSFTNGSVLYSRFECFGSNSDSVTFRGGLRGLVDVNSSVLEQYVVAWVASGDNVTLQGAQYKFDSDCLDEVIIEDLDGPECGIVSKTDSGSLTIGEAFAVAIAEIVGAVVIAFLIFFLCNWKFSFSKKRYIWTFM